MTPSSRHHRLKAEVLLALTKYPNTRIWNQPTAVAQLETGERARFGVTGQADLTGITYGYRLEVECKTGSGVPSKKQLAWAKMIELHGGIYLLVHSAEEAVLLLDAAIQAKLSGRDAAKCALEEAHREVDQLEAYAEWVENADPGLSLERYRDFCDTSGVDAPTDQ